MKAILPERRLMIQHLTASIYLEKNEASTIYYQENIY